MLNHIPFSFLLSKGRLSLTTQGNSSLCITSRHRHKRLHFVRSKHSRSASPILMWVQVPWGCCLQADSRFVLRRKGLSFYVSEQSPGGRCWWSLLSRHWIARSYRTSPQTRSIWLNSQWCVMKAFLKTLQVDQPHDNLVSDTGVASLTKIRKTTSRVWTSGDHSLQRNCPVLYNDHFQSS